MKQISGMYSLRRSHIKILFFYRLANWRSIVFWWERPIVDCTGIDIFKQWRPSIHSIIYSIANEDFIPLDMYPVVSTIDNSELCNCNGSNVLNCMSLSIPICVCGTINCNQSRNEQLICDTTQGLNWMHYYIIHHSSLFFLNSSLQPNTSNTQDWMDHSFSVRLFGH